MNLAQIKEELSHIEGSIEAGQFAPTTRQFHKLLSVTNHLVEIVKKQDELLSEVRMFTCPL